MIQTTTQRGVSGGVFAELKLVKAARLRELRRNGRLPTSVQVYAKPKGGPPTVFPIPADPTPSASSASRRGLSSTKRSPGSGSTSPPLGLIFDKDGVWYPRP